MTKLEEDVAGLVVAAKRDGRAAMTMSGGLRLNLFHGTRYREWLLTVTVIDKVPDVGVGVALASSVVEGAILGGTESRGKFSAPRDLTDGDSTVFAVQWEAA